eukprot:GAHX01002266.1.p1 GENE.GAHX01002266.1~~GAHX01002266.1.p1  ORF type:complete len:198 (-),score=45.57 GAHX01002266.1:29-622(-)
MKLKISGMLDLSYSESLSEDMVDLTTDEFFIKRRTPPSDSLSDSLSISLSDTESDKYPGNKRKKKVKATHFFKEFYKKKLKTLKPKSKLLTMKDINKILKMNEDQLKLQDEINIVLNLDNFFKAKIFGIPKCVYYIENVATNGKKTWTFFIFNSKIDPKPENGSFDLITYCKLKSDIYTPNRITTIYLVLDFKVHSK